MPVNIQPQDEKIWQYLLEHSTPVTKEKIMKQFMIARSHASRALSYFVEQGIAEVIKIGHKKFYRVKE